MYVPLPLRFFVIRIALVLFWSLNILVFSHAKPLILFLRPKPRLLNTSHAIKFTSAVSIVYYISARLALGAGTPY
jgi:hypothetical protein